MQPVVLYVGRILFGGFFIMSGYNHFAKLVMMGGYAQSKGIPASKAAVGLTGLLLLTGGISTLFNFYPVVGLTALVLFFVPVTFSMHAYWKIQDPMARMGERVNFTKNIALLGATLMLLSGLLS